jgi:hypothetical protein
VGVYEHGTPKRVVDSLQAIGLTGIETIPHQIPQHVLDDAKHRLSAIASTQDLVDMPLPHGCPAWHFYDGMLKHEQIGTIAPDHPRLPTYLARTLHYLESYEKIFERHNVRGVVVSHPNYPKFYTLIWAALRRGIPVYQTMHANEQIAGRRFLQLSDYNGRLADRPPANLLKMLSLDLREQLISQGRQYYSAVRDRQAGQFSILDIYGKEDTSRTEFCQLIGADPDKPNVVVMTSCWSDCPNSGGRTYYSDYLDLLDQTLEVMREVKNCNWILKPHPAEFMYSDTLRLRNMVSGKLPKNAYLWPDNLGARTIEEIADCVVTPSGTSGIEYAALGKRVLVCRDTGYTPWDFVNWAHDATDFRNKLAHAWDLPTPTRKQQEDAFIYMALTFTSPPNTRGRYLYRWGSESWQIWPSVRSFIRENRESIEREIAMLKRWIGSDIDSYNTFKWLHAGNW